MADSPAHAIGQIVGETFEMALGPMLEAFCDKHDLYLDKRGPRRARSGVVVRWEDGLGNKHDLDYVIERGGSEDEIGVPVAFIETAWRRNTKHSKAKAQELEAAVLPVVAKLSHVKPFIGALLAGEYTTSSLNQLRSNGFSLQLVPYRAVVEAFTLCGIDMAFHERTPEAELQSKLARLQALTPAEKDAVGDALRDAAKSEASALIDALSEVVLRRVEGVSILPLHGSQTSVSTVREANKLLRGYVAPQAPGALIRFEVAVRYDNGDHIMTDFANAADAVAFLKSFA